MLRASALLLVGLLLSLRCALATAAPPPHQDHGPSHTASSHATPAVPHASTEHNDHAHGPPGEINWFYGFLGENAEEEPSILWRRPNTPPPFLANIINFAVFAYVLVRFAKKPIQLALHQRKDAIMRDIDAAQKMRLDAEKRLDDYENKLKHIDAEVERIRKDFREQGEREHQRILHDAQEKRQQMLKETAFMIEQAKKQVQTELMRETVEAAIASAQKILQEAVADADHDRLCKDYVQHISQSQGLSVTKGGSA